MRADPEAAGREFGDDGTAKWIWRLDPAWFSVVASRNRICRRPSTASSRSHGYEGSSEVGLSVAA